MMRIIIIIDRCFAVILVVFGFSFPSLDAVVVDSTLDHSGVAAISWRLRRLHSLPPFLPSRLPQQTARRDVNDDVTLEQMTADCALWRLLTKRRLYWRERNGDMELQERQKWRRYWATEGKVKRMLEMEEWWENKTKWKKESRNKESGVVKWKGSGIEEGRHGQAGRPVESEGASET